MKHWQKPEMPLGENSGGDMSTQPSDAIEREKRTQQAFGEYRRAMSDGRMTDELLILSLVQQGVNPDQKVGNAWTLLHWAANYGYTEICALLIEQGADVNAQNNQSEMPLHLAAKVNTATCALLIRQGADVDTRDNFGLTPLHWAATGDYTKTGATICALLIEQGADVNARTDAGWTPLDGATKWLHNLTIKALLDHGANVCVEDKNNLLQPHRDKWQPILAEVMGGNCDAIKTTEDLYHLASVMKPENPQDISEPKEFIRELFARYLPHNEHLNKLYSTIFNKPRGPETLAETRDAARKEQRGVV